MKFYALVMTTQQFPGNCNNIVSQSFQSLKEFFLSISEVRCNSLSFPCRSANVVPPWIREVFLVGTGTLQAVVSPFPNPWNIPNKYICVMVQD